MPISAPPPSWASIKNKPNTMSGFGITDGVQSLNGQTGAITNTSFGAVGSYLIAAASDSGTVARSAGSTVSGSSLLISNTIGYPLFSGTGLNTGQLTSAGVSGTWRAMNGYMNTGNAIYSDSSYRIAGLWQRIA